MKFHSGVKTHDLKTRQILILDHKICPKGEISVFHTHYNEWFYFQNLYAKMIFLLAAYALPMFKETKSTSTKKFEERVRKDPIKSKRPELPVTGPGMNTIHFRCINWKLSCVPSTVLHM